MPKKTPRQKVLRKHRIAVQVNPAEWTVLERWAASKGVPLATWARAELFEAAKRDGFPVATAAA